MVNPEAEQGYEEFLCALVQAVKFDERLGTAECCEEIVLIRRSCSGEVGKCQALQGSDGGGFPAACTSGCRSLFYGGVEVCQCRPARARVVAGGDGLLQYASRAVAQGVGRGHDINEEVGVKGALQSWWWNKWVEWKWRKVATWREDFCCGGEAGEEMSPRSFPIEKEERNPVLGELLEKVKSHICFSSAGSSKYGKILQELSTRQARRPFFPLVEDGPEVVLSTNILFWRQGKIESFGKVAETFVREGHDVPLDHLSELWVANVFGVLPSLYLLGHEGFELSCNMVDVHKVIV